MKSKKIWFFFAGFHLLLVAGTISGFWPLEILSDGLSLMVVFDVLCFLFLVWRRKNAAHHSKASFNQGIKYSAICAAIGAVIFGLSPGLGSDGFWKPHRHAAPFDEKMERRINVLQGNAQDKGNPWGWHYDIVALAEALGAPIVAPAGMSKVAGGPQNTTDIALFSRFSRINSGVIDPKSSWHQGVWATLKTPAGPLMVIAVHTRSPVSLSWHAQRNEFLKQLASFIEKQPKDTPIILLGDFNVTPQGLPFRQMTTRLAIEQEPDPYSPTWPAATARFKLGFRIDRVLGLQGARIESWGTLPKSNSDHLFAESIVIIPQQKMLWMKQKQVPVKVKTGVFQ